MTKREETMFINGKWVSLEQMPGVYLAPDKGAGGSPPPADPPSNPPETPPPATTPGATSPESGKVEFTAEQQAHLDKLIGDARKQGREKAETDAKAEAEKAKTEAEQASLKEQAEWQKLAEQHEAKVAELEPQVAELAAQTEAYSAVIAELLEADVEELGDEAKTAIEALPGEQDALAQLQWLKANRGLFKSEEALRGSPPGARKKSKDPANVKPVVVKL